MTPPRREVQVRWLFEPRDLWVGVYWDIGSKAMYSKLSVYICLLPMLPIRIEVWPWRTQ